MDKNTTENRPRKLISITAGVITGLCNGLFGAGGGMVAVLTLNKLCKMPAQKAHATAICIMLPLTVVSIAVYLFNNAIKWDMLPWTTPAFFIGGLLGAKLLGKLSKLWLNRIFSILMLVAALWMIFGG